jgi:hypothetical protein
MPEETTQTTTETTPEPQTTEDTQTQTAEDTTQKTTETTPTDETEATKDESTLLGSEGEEAKAEVPEKYEFTVPEGMEIDNALVEILSPVMKEVGLTQESAQKLADAYIPYVEQQVKSNETAAIEEWNKKVEEWKTQTTQELGASLKEDLVTASKFIDKFGSSKVREVLNETGLGNHPELVKLFVKAGKAISEDTFVEPGKKGKAGGGLDQLYDHPTSKQ